MTITMKILKLNNLIVILSLLSPLAAFSIKTQDERIIPISSFYPFGTSNGDKLLTRGDDTFEGPINISTIFPFFQKPYSSVFVSVNGFISFERGVTAYVPQQFPLRDFIGVAPFWTDIDTRCKGQIFYRDETKESILRTISNEIKEAFPQFPNYQATWSFIVTYYQVAPFNCQSPINTFQAILLTNGRHSFTIFNYETLQWPSASTGHKSQAGFNAGDGTTSYSIEGSFLPSILQINSKSNVGKPGKWIFRIDQANITEGGCNSEGYFIVTPTVVYFTGGEDVLIGGPCFRGTDNITLLFDNKKEVQCTYVDSSNALCKVPYLDRVGRIPLNMTINNSSKFAGFLMSKEIAMQSYLTSIKPFYDTQNLKMLEISYNFTSISKKRSENKKLLYFAVYFLSIDNPDTLYPNLIELNSNFTPAYSVVHMEFLKEREDVYEKPGYVIIAGVYEEKGKIVHQWLDVAESTIANTRTTAKAWYNFCTNWYEEQPDPKPLLNALPPCPRVIQPLPNGKYPQTNANFKLDASCHPNSYSGVLKCDVFHAGAKGCYRSISSAMGAGQQCCYDKNNRLLVGPPGGGTLDAAHSDTSVWEHFKKDVLPYFACCNPVAKACDKYYEKRPSDDGARWNPPVPAGGSGDPHFLTLDNVGYTFNGFGEFVLVVIEDIDFEVQVRLAPFVDRSTGIRRQGTVFKGIATKRTSEVDSLQIELDMANLLAVYVNRIQFDLLSVAEENALQLNGLNLYFNEYEYLIQYQNGINIKLVLNAEKDAFLVFVTMPDEFKGKTKGLLGVFDGNKSNDFMLPNGTVLAIEPSDDKDIFYSYGYFWKNTANSTLFTYGLGSYASYFDNSYFPKFLSDGIAFTNSTLEELAKEVCGENKMCLYDVSTTNSLSTGLQNLIFEEEIESIQIFNEEALLTCSPLSSIFENGLIESETLSNGFKYTFTCDKDFCIKGQSVVFCRNGTYEAEVPKCLKCDIKPSSASNLKILGFTFIFPLLFLIF